MSVRHLSLRTKTLFCTYMLPPRGRTKPNFAAQLQTDRNLESILDMRLHVCIHGCARMELGSADRSSTLSPEAPEHSLHYCYIFDTHMLSVQSGHCYQVSKVPGTHSTHIPKVSHKLTAPGQPTVYTNTLRAQTLCKAKRRPRWLLQGVLGPPIRHGLPVRYPAVCESEMNKSCF